jgi:acetyl esterase
MIKVALRARLDPQMAAALEESRRLYRDIGAGEGVAGRRAAYAHERAFWNAIKPDLAAVEALAVAGPGGPIACRLYRPSLARPLPALVFFHGGGWVLGDLDTHDRILRLLAQKSGAAVLGVDYRLAPENKFPAPYDDALAALRHVMATGPALGIDVERLAVGGDSAGGNLALATLLQLAPAERRAVKAQLLYYGAFGLLDSPSLRVFGSDPDGLTKADMDAYRAHLIRDPADLVDIRLDCLSGDLRGLPPAFIAVGDLDPLLDDSRALAFLLKEAGVAHELVIYEGVLHGFLHYSRMVDKAMQALDTGAAMLRRAFGVG